MNKRTEKSFKAWLKRSDGQRAALHGTVRDPDTLVALVEAVEQPALKGWMEGLMRMAYAAGVNDARER